MTDVLLAVGLWGALVLAVLFWTRGDRPRGPKGQG